MHGPCCLLHNMPYDTRWFQLPHRTRRFNRCAKAFYFRVGAGSQPGRRASSTSLPSRWLDSVQELAALAHLSTYPCYMYGRLVALFAWLCSTIIKGEILLRLNYLGTSRLRCIFISRSTSTPFFPLLAGPCERSLHDINNNISYITEVALTFQLGERVSK